MGLAYSIRMGMKSYRRVLSEGGLPVEKVADKSRGLLSVGGVWKRHFEGVQGYSRTQVY